jgi:hypothetical protein
MVFRDKKEKKRNTLTELLPQYPIIPAIPPVRGYGETD